LNVALIGFGSVGKAFARLLDSKNAQYPFRIVGVHTARQGTAVDPAGLGLAPAFGPRAESVEAFLDASRAEVAVEITPLQPETGEPAISHIRTAFARGLHVITANKGPIAFAYRALRAEAQQAGVQFRFESTVMDGAPVFNLVRTAMPGLKVLGFSGVLNSTTNVVIDAMASGRTFEEGVEDARRLGVAEADASFDTDGWDAAAKTATLVNVLMDGDLTPHGVDRKGIGRLTPDKIADLADRGKTVRLVSRARASNGSIRARVRAEVLDRTDLLAGSSGTSNLLLIETDLMGTVGTMELAPGVDQTAYGIFADLVDIARNL
jgi:homoserine dehydrogenase